jgi:hypothetical protein
MGGLESDRTDALLLAYHKVGALALGTTAWSARAALVRRAKANAWRGPLFIRPALIVSSRTQRSVLIPGTRESYHCRMRFICVALASTRFLILIA